MSTDRKAFLRYIAQLEEWSVPQSTGRMEEAVNRWLRESGTGFACHHCRRAFLGIPRAFVVVGGQVFTACKACYERASTPTGEKA